MAAHKPIIMADRILTKNEIALPQDVKTTRVERLEFNLVEEDGKKQIFIKAMFKLDVSGAQFEGATVADGNYIFTVNKSAIFGDATPKIVFGETDAPNSIKMNPAEILAKGEKHSWGN